MLVPSKAKFDSGEFIADRVHRIRRKSLVTAIHCDGFCLRLADRATRYGQRQCKVFKTIITSTGQYPVFFIHKNVATYLQVGNAIYSHINIVGSSASARNDVAMDASPF